MAEQSAHLWRGLNWPNKITLLRILGVVPFVLLLLNQRTWSPGRQVAMCMLVAMGVSDAVDGYLARRQGMITRLGSILDPLADKLLITCAAILLATERASVPGARLPNWVVVFIVGKDLWVVIGFLVVFLITGQVRIHPTRAGKACTMAQLVMVTLVLAVPEFNRLGGSAGTHLATALSWSVMALCVLAVASYTRLGLSFLAEAGDAGAKKPGADGREEHQAVEREQSKG